LLHPGLRLHDEAVAEPIQQTSPDLPHAFDGACHCGAIGFTLRTSRRPEQWQVRACQCRFCRAHGARTVSDPAGSVTFSIADPSKLTRYRFATGSADFLMCGACGVYIAAVLASSRGRFATVNVNAIDNLQNVPEAVPVSYEGEEREQRESRREQRWTPVSGAI
jgi:hypothetical protein